MFGFRKSYFLLFLLLFAIEVYIGLYLHDTVIRPYGGDFLVVILLYCLVEAVTRLPVLLGAAWVLVFAYVIEISQYFHLVNMLGLQNFKLAKLLLGTTFSFIDLFTYTLGILAVIIVENLRTSLKNF
jgi:hypothetical protein